MPQPSTTIVTVSNLPVITFINATIQINDGPEDTLNARIAEAVKAGHWERAHGDLAEDYEDLVLELNETLVDNRWEFDTTPHTPATPGRISLTYGEMPTREQYNVAWDLTVGNAMSFSFKNDLRVGTTEMGRWRLWAELQSAHAQHGLGDEEAGTWCSQVLGCLGIEWI